MLEYAEKMYRGSTQYMIESKAFAGFSTGRSIVEERVHSHELDR